LLLHCAVTVRVLSIVVSNVVLLTTLNVSPSKAFDAFFIYVNCPPDAMIAVPAGPIALTVKSIHIVQCKLLIPGIVIAPVSARTTLPDLTLNSNVSLLCAEICPANCALKLSPTANPFAGIDKVPKPVPINDPSTVVAHLFLDLLNLQATMYQQDLLM